MTFPALAAMVSLTADRFRDAGLNPPRLVLASAGDYDKLRAMIPEDERSHYDFDEAGLTINGARIYPPKERG